LVRDHELSSIIISRLNGPVLWVALSTSLLTNWSLFGCDERSGSDWNA
jgi:hypothetical protein